MIDNSLKLRPYQEEALKTINSLPDGSRSICCLATGLGKTVVAANIDHNGRILWLSHRDELVRQPEKYYTANGLTFGIEKADEHGNGEDVISASVQSLYRDDRLHQYSPDDFDIIICDEAHHAAAPSYQKILSYFTPRKLIGLTATPQRGDNLRLSDIFDSICFIRDLRWGIENGYLSRIRCLRVQAEYDMNNLKKCMGDFTASGLEDTLSSSDADLVLTKAYIEHCLPQHRQTLIYCPTVNICRLVMSTMKMTLPDDEKDTVRMLWDGISPEERKETLKLYKEGKVHAIINCMILTEGTDLPNTTCIINNRPTANATLYQQIIGRGTRLYEGKDYCLIIDVVGQNSKNKGLCTAPTLFGIDPDLLPEKIRAEITEKKDLIEICDEISEIRAETAKSIKLQQEIIDIFTQERLRLIKDNIGQGYAAIADKYNDYLIESVDPTYDFGDILIKQMYSDKCYYKIEPTYHGVIYLSKPDALENTIIDVNIPGIDLDKNQSGYDFISEPMPMNQAIDFIYNFLKYCIPFYYITKWSKSGRESMISYDATDKQLWRIKKDYKNYDIKAEDINRLQASDLIDLLMEIGSLRLKKAQLSCKASELIKAENKKELKKYKQKTQKELEKEFQINNQRKQNYTKQLKLIRKRIEKAKADEAVFHKECIPGKTTRAQIPINYKYYPDQTMPSAAQINFADNLLKQMKQKKVCFNYKFDPHNNGMDKGHFSFIIDFLININNKLRTNHEYITVVNLKSVISQIENISPSNKPEKMIVEYMMVSQEELAERMRKNA